MKLLVVEDDRKTAGFLRKGFEEEGFAVRVARDGPEGVASAVAEPPDLAVVDVMLPGMCGLEAVRARLPHHPRPQRARPCWRSPCRFCRG